MDWLIQNAYAQAEGGGAESLMGLLPLVLIFAVFYFLLIRPQNKRQKSRLRSEPPDSCATTPT